MTESYPPPPWWRPSPVWAQLDAMFSRHPNRVAWQAQVDQDVTMHRQAMRAAGLDLDDTTTRRVMLWHRDMVHLLAWNLTQVVQHHEPRVAAQTIILTLVHYGAILEALSAP